MISPTHINMKFEIIGDSVWMSKKDFHKLLKWLKSGGVEIRSKELTLIPKKRGGKN